MKKIFFGLTLLLVITTLECCTKADTPLYTRKNGVYFQLYTDYYNKDKDTIDFSFAKLDASITEQVIDIRVNLQGIPQDVDRKFILKVDSENSTAIEGVDYLALDPYYTIAREEYYTLVPVTIIRSPTLKENSLLLSFLLEESDDLELGLQERQSATIRYTDRITKPIYWDIYVGMWGEWSQVKQLTIEQVLGWEFPERREDYSTEPFYSTASAGSNFMNEWFKNNVVYDENNEQIKPWK